VVQAHLGQRLARVKAEVARHPVGFLRGGVVRGLDRQGEQGACREREYPDRFRDRLPHDDLRPHLLPEEEKSMSETMPPVSKDTIRIFLKSLRPVKADPLVS